jgi:glycosyltransferase involved in cell wall biosynthesis
MRIFYDHQVFSLQDAGGVSRYQYELVRNLHASPGVEFELLMGLNASVMSFFELRNQQTKVHSWKTGIRPGYQRYAINEALSSVIAPRLGSFDIYHAMLYRAVPFVRRRHLVVTHHDCTHERFPQMFHNASFIIQRKRKLFSRADAIICVSESSRRDLLHFYDVDEKKTHVVYHGFSPLHVDRSVTDPVDWAGVPYLLYVGSRAEYKNFPLLLDAFSRSGLAANYRLLVVGGGDFSAAEQARITSLGLVGKITLIPRADETTLARVYRDAALFVYPSLYEGFGFPPLEAMSLGCPVLVHRTSSLPEICGDAAFYFDVSDPDELARALVSTLQNAPGLAMKRQLGEQQVKLFDWGQTAAKTLNIYRALSNRKSKRSRLSGSTA